MGVAISVALLWTFRLACWPYEVEGHEPVAPAAISAPPPAPPPDSVASPTAEPPSLPAAVVPPPPPAVPPPKPRPPEHPRVAALPVQEEARYDVRYGLLGSVGEVMLSVGGIDAGADGTRVLKIRGVGQGAVLGLGSMRRRIESELDLSLLAPRRWTVVRQRPNDKDGGGTVDSGARGAGNAWTLERTNPGQAPAKQSVTFQAPTDDPLGLLWRLRTIPPGAGQSQTHQLLDGLQLWRVDVTAAGAAEILSERETAIRLDGTLSPIQYDGHPDPDRPTRTFTLWLSDGAGHLPLRLEVPVGLGDVVITLTG
jgi:hypothetical protein